MKPRVKLFLTILFFISLCIGVTAQTKEINPRLASPRDCVRQFLRIMNKVEYEKAPRIDEATPCLYLDDVPEASRIAVGREMALKLFRILYSFTFRVDVLPVKTDNNTYTLPIGSDKGMDLSLRRYDNGEWKFNYARTLVNLDKYIEILDAEQESKQEDTTVDPTFRSPRETLRYFFSNMGKENNDGTLKAAQALDLRSFEKSIRKEIGKERAILLNAVLARSRYIDLVELSDDSQSAPVILLNDPIGRVIIEKATASGTAIGAWKFSSSTVEALPELYDAYREKEVIEGVKDLVSLPMSIRVRNYMKNNYPTLMKESVFLENWQWIGLFIVVFLGLTFGKFVIYLLTNVIKVFFQKAKVDIDTDTHKRFLSPINVASTAFFWWSGLYMLGLPSDARVILLVSVKVVAAISAVWSGYRMVDVIGNYLIGKAAQTETKFDDLLAPLITRAMKVMVVIGGLVFLADIFAIEIDKIMAGLGLGGLAFALAAKDTISNIFGSITILVDRPFQIGDWVTIGKADGVVESVGIRSTRIRTFYDSLITIPNSELINAQIDNYGARTYRRIYTYVNISYNTPPDKIDAFCEGIRELIRKHPCTRKDFFIINLDKFDAYSLGIIVYCFVKTPNWVEEKRETHRLLNDIIRLARKLGVEFAVPTGILYNRESKEPAYPSKPIGKEAEAKLEGARIADGIMREAGIIKSSR